MTLSTRGRTFISALALGLLLSLAGAPEASAAVFTTTIPDSHFCTYDSALGTTVPAACDEVEVTLTTDKATYLPGETVTVTGAMRLLNPKTGSNNLLTYFSSSYTLSLTGHRYYISATVNGVTKDLFNYPYGTTAPAAAPYTCSKLGSFGLPLCLPTGTAIFTAPAVNGAYSATCSAFIGQTLYQVDDKFTATIPPATCRVSFTVASPLPNLTAGLINETTAVAGSGKVFTALISNNGTASTTTGFFNLLQRAETYDATTKVATGISDAGYRSQLPILGPYRPSTTFSFLSYPVPGGDAGTTKFFRACADRSSGAGAGQGVTESNEGDNCGDWTAVAISAGPTPNLIGTTPVTSSNVYLGNSVSFDAQVTNNGTASTPAVPIPNAFRISFNASKTAPYTWVRATTLTGPLAQNTSANISAPSSFSASTLGTFYVQTCANYNTTGTPPTSGAVNTAFTEVSTADNCGSWSSVNVLVDPVVGKPNLRVFERVSPQTATVGVVSSYSVPVYNTSTDTDVTASFPVLLQKTNSIDAGGNPTTPVDFVNTVTVTTDVLRSNSATISVPTLVGTWSSGDAGLTRHLRICADKSSAADMDGNIVESNTEDNCGEWTPISVAAAPSGTLSVPNCTIASGNSSCTVSSATWSVSNAGTPSIQNKITSLVYSLTGTSGTETLTLNGPPGSINFDLRSTQSGVTTVLATDPGVASCAAGTSWSGGQCAAYQCTGSVPSGGVVYAGDTTSLTSTLAYAYAAQPGTARKCEYYCSAGTEFVGGTCLSAPETSILADPLRVPKGNNTTLEWSATNGATCSVSRSPAASPWPIAGNPGTQTDSVTAQTVYTATCTNAAGSDTKSVTVNIFPDFTEF